MTPSEDQECQKSDDNKPGGRIQIVDVHHEADHRFIRPLRRLWELALTTLGVATQAAVHWILLVAILAWLTSLDDGLLLLVREWIGLN